MSIVTYALGFVTGVVLYPVVKAGVSWLSSRIKK